MLGVVKVSSWVERLYATVALLVPLLAEVVEISHVSVVLVFVNTQLSGSEVPDSNPSDKYWP